MCFKLYPRVGDATNSFWNMVRSTQTPRRASLIGGNIDDLESYSKSKFFFGGTCINPSFILSAQEDSERLSLRRVGREREPLENS